MRVLLFFIDGFGLGSNNPGVNPIARFGLPVIERLFGRPLTAELALTLAPERCLVPLDATLGVPGLPQSATGQGAILTGLNTARAMGRHIQAFPGPQLAHMITGNNIMGRLAKAGLPATSANMYTPNYFELVAKRKRRHSAITLAALSTGRQLRSVAEMRNKEAVYQDITNASLPAWGVPDLPVLTPTQAAENLVNISRKYFFTIFEYFQTDRAGHKQDWQAAAAILALLDEFIDAVVRRLPADTLFLLTSDHGNFEDMSVKTHTVNKVPLIALGRQAQAAVGAVTDLTGIALAIAAVLGKDGPCD